MCCTNSDKLELLWCGLELLGVMVVVILSCCRLNWRWVSSVVLADEKFAINSNSVILCLNDIIQGIGSGNIVASYTTISLQSCCKQMIKYNPISFILCKIFEMLQYQISVILFMLFLLLESQSAGKQFIVGLYHVQFMNQVD